MDRRALVGYLAAWGIAALFLGILTPLTAKTPATVMDEAVLATFLLSGAVAGALLSILPRQGVLGPGLGRALLLWFGWMVAGLGLSFLLRNHTFPFDRWNILLLILSIVAGLGAYGVVWFGRWAWPRWKELRDSRFLWSLTNSHLAVVTGLVFVFTLFGVVGALVRAGWSAFPLLSVPEIPLLLGLLLQGVISLAVFILLLGASLLVVLPSSALFSFWVARRHTRRLEALAQAARALREGDFSRQVPVDGKDELAQLQSDFNQMSAELEGALRALRAERDKSKALLQVQHDLAANVSHDLRTPLTLLRGLLERNLEHGPEQPLPDLLQSEKVMLHQVEQLQLFVQDLLTLSQAQVDHLNIYIEAVDGAEIVQRVVDAAAPAAWQRGRVTVRAEIPPGLPALYADADRLEQVLQNLVQNGVRHTPPGGLVAVSVSEEQDRVRFDIIDSGEGIPADELPLIWERYYRADSSSSGSGLGLAIVKELVTAMSGQVAASSEPGEGSQFSVFLPRVL